MARVDQVPIPGGADFQLCTDCIAQYAYFEPDLVVETLVEDKMSRRRRDRHGNLIDSQMKIEERRHRFPQLLMNQLGRSRASLIG